MKKKLTTKTAGRTRKATKRDAARTARTPATKRTKRTRDPRLPVPGTTLTRTFKGKDLRVAVLDEGFRWDGKEFRSLTAVALAITGYPACSGPHFFGLDAAPATSSRTTKRTSAKGTKDAAPTPATPVETATA